MKGTEIDTYNNGDERLNTVLEEPGKCNSIPGLILFNLIDSTD